MTEIVVLLMNSFIYLACIFVIELLKGCLAKISKVLRKERELAFYGDTCQIIYPGNRIFLDFIPTEGYNKNDAMKAMTNASLVVDVARGGTR